MKIKGIWSKQPETSLKLATEFSDKWHILLAQVGLFSYFLYLQKPLDYFLFWLLPLATVVLMLNRMRVLVEHAGTSNADDSYTLLPSANIKSNILERLIISPYNFNYHLEHHRKPSLFHQELPQQFKLRTKGKREEILKTHEFCFRKERLLASS